jgi:hypothetical protein
MTLEYYYAECHFAQCRGFIVMLSIIMLNVIILSADMLCVVCLINRLINEVSIKCQCSLYNYYIVPESPMPSHTLLLMYSNLIQLSAWEGDLNV